MCQIRSALRKYFVVVLLLPLACQPQKRPVPLSRLDSAIAARIRQWTLVPDRYQPISTVRTRTVLQVEWLTQEAQSRQQLAEEYKQVKDWKQSRQVQQQIQQRLQAVRQLLTSYANLVHHYEYLHTCRLQMLDGRTFQAQYLIEADTTDQLLAVRRHR
jgi:hypothetical protein